MLVPPRAPYYSVFVMICNLPSMRGGEEVGAPSDDTFLQRKRGILLAAAAENVHGIEWGRMVVWYDE